MFWFFFVCFFPPEITVIKNNVKVSAVIQGLVKGEDGLTTHWYRGPSPTVTKTQNSSVGP